MTVALMIAVFVAGYLCIALEHKIGINKSAVALLMCGVLWTMLILSAHTLEPSLSAQGFQTQLTDFLGQASEILFFLIGAMTIVDLIDLHGGFDLITRRITARNKRRLLWLLAAITFTMSALLDNMTTTIIMVMLLRKLVTDPKERWIYASVVVIAANSGGAWSPIGDVTTIMLWMQGNTTAAKLVENLLLPCITSLAIPTALAARMLPSGSLVAVAQAGSARPQFISPRESLFILVLGAGLLVSVPLFKSLTGLPPYMGVITALGIVWVVTEIMYDRKRDIEESIKERVSKVLKHLDMPTILFFLGILMSVSALEGAGVLSRFAQALDKGLHNIFLIDPLIGLLSSVVDNVPLVAACMGMYPLTDAASVAAAADPAYAAMFLPDGAFWHLLAYCAGVGGSLLIIGSAAGVVAMGLEKINFMWYLKRISLLALAGYAAGILLFMALHALRGGHF